MGHTMCDGRWVQLWSATSTSTIKAEMEIESQFIEATQEVQQDSYTNNKIGKKITNYTKWIEVLGA